MITLKPSQLLTLLKACIPAKHSVLITGAPGIGKTEIGEQAAHACGADMILSHPVTADPTDAKGLPAKISDTEATFLPYGDLLRAMRAERLTVWFFDDLGQAAPSTQAAYMQLFLKREINGKRISDNIVFLAATNRRTDKADVQGILEPVKSRFRTIVELQADMQELCEYAITLNGAIPPEMIAYWRMNPDAISDFKPTADMTNSPMPRTWFNLAKLQALGLPAEIESVAFIGAVGEQQGISYQTFRRLCSSMVSIDAILTDPMGSALPKKPAEGYAISTGLAARTNEKTLTRVGQYATRLANDGQGEFAALIIRDALRRNGKLANSKDYINIMCGPVGKLISGQSLSK